MKQIDVKKLKFADYTLFSVVLTFFSEHTFPLLFKIQKERV